VICPTCYQRCRVQPPAGLSDVFYRWQGRLLPLVTYSCTDCAEDYTFAQGGQDLAIALEQAQHREPCWH
jgi:hypothetical protein